MRFVHLFAIAMLALLVGGCAVQPDAGTEKVGTIKQAMTNSPVRLPITSTTFNAITALSYNSTNKHFVDGSSNAVYLGAMYDNVGTDDDMALGFGTVADSGTYPLFKVNQLLADIFIDGTWYAHSGDPYVMYDGTCYQFELMGDGSISSNTATSTNNAFVRAVAVTC